MNTYYPQNQNFAPQYNNGYQGYAPQPMPVAPVAASSSSSIGLLMVAGLAVVGAAAFGGVYLMNSSHDAPAQTAASAPSTVVNLPSEINIPGLNTNTDPASPIVVNNPAPIKVFTPSTPRSNNNTVAPVQGQAPVVQGQTPVVQSQTPVNAGTPAPANTTTTGTTTTGTTTTGTTTTDTGKTDPPKTDTGKTDPPKTDTGKTDPPKTDTGKTDPPKTDTTGGGAPDVDPIIDYGGCACG